MTSKCLSTRPVIAAMLAVLFLALSISAARAELWNTVREWNSAVNTGSYALIENTNPSVSSGFSYNRIASAGGSYFIEVGAVKWIGKNNDTPYWLWTYNDGNGQEFSSPVNSLITDSLYNFKVEHASGDNWEIYFNEMETPDVDNVDINQSSRPTVWAGAEVDNLSNDVGSADVLDVMYRDSSGVWNNLCNTSPLEQSTENYLSSVDSSSCNDFLIYDVP